MTTIYLVVASGGQYEDHWTRNVGARHTQEDAQALVEACAASNARLVEAYPGVYAVFRDTLRSASAFLHTPDRPAVRSAHTPESAALHAASLLEWQQVCKQITLTNEQQHRVTVLLAGEAACQEGRNLGLTEEDLDSIFLHDYPGFEDATYEIEELEIQ